MTDSGYPIFLPERPTHFNEMEKKKKKNTLWGFTFSLSRLKDTGVKKAHKIVLPSPTLPYECIYTLILKLKHT